MLNVQANRQGRARIVVTADNGQGDRVFDAIDVTVVGPPECAGDCNADGAVTVDEVIVGVRIALDAEPFERCPALDRDANGEVAIADLISAVSHVLGGCGA